MQRLQYTYQDNNNLAIAQDLERVEVIFSCSKLCSETDI